ncbi:MAG: hypothetical protein AAGA25_02695 [Planctomycetota bacterium]
MAKDFLALAAVEQIALERIVTGLLKQRKNKGGGDELVGGFA